METVEQQWTQAEQEIVRASLNNMLACPLFAGSPRQARFLDYLVTNTLLGDADRLKGYTIAVEVFDRKDDFDPSLDAIVRVEATRLRHKLLEYHDTLGKLDDVRIDFPKGGYALEITLQPNQKTALALNPIKYPVLVEDKPSLAVLPFANIGADNTKEYFADGVVDSLISMLSRLSGLFVISRQSSFAYKNSTKTSKEIVAELGMRYLLEGSVQHAGKQVRVTAQLVDAMNGGHIWSDRFDRELKGIFALQDDLTQKIVSVLQIKLDSAEAAFFGVQATSSIEAHDTLLQAISQHRKYAEKPVSEAIALFKKALALDPNYAAAHAWLARSLSLISSQRWNLAPAILDEALLHAERAVELDSQSSYAVSILGWVHLWRRNREESIVYGRNAVTLDPNNSEAQLFLSITLCAADFGEEALYYIERAQRFSPIPDVFYVYTHGMCFYVLKNYHRTIATFELGCKLNPHFMPNHVFQMFAYERLGMQAEVRQKFETIIALKNGDRSVPLSVLWTDSALADEYMEFWKQVCARYPAEI